MRAGVTAPPASGGEGAALLDVGAAVVLVLGRLTRVGALDGIPPVGPRREGPAAARRYPQVVAGGRDRPIAELLVVRIARGVADPRLAGPGRAGRGRGRAVDVERCDGVARRIVADGARPR